MHVVRVSSLLLLFTFKMLAQFPEDAVAIFNFDNGKSTDLVQGRVPLIYGCRLLPDRFGNKNSALYFQGTEYSYAKLGPCAMISNKKGSVSLWLNMHGLMGSGKGIESNPVFWIRSHEVELCNDAIYIGVDMNTHRINGASDNSALEMVSIYSGEPMKHGQWKHVVLTYDSTFLVLYVDGDPQYRAPKKFTTRFLAGDSILLGGRTGIINQRYFLGCIDDIMLFNRVLTDDEVKQLYDVPDPNRSRIVIKWIIVFAALISLLFLAAWLIRRRIKMILEREKKKDLLRNRWLEQENKVLSAQMDPHFIFNSLNTIHHLIVANENEKAQHYLSKFSRLIRKILETNTRESVSLEEEIEICEKYLEIESLRFNRVFTYRIGLDENIDPKTIFIPHFMLQPIIENAIWHGLLPKEGEKMLTISFSLSGEGSLLSTIEDNGIGRAEARKKRKINKKSLALNFIEQRLQLFSKLRNNNYHLQILDRAKEDGEALGTTVVISLPLLTTKEYETSDYN